MSSTSAAGSLASNQEQFDPPPYTPPQGFNNNYGFPTGYFVIKNLATGRLLDVGSDSLDDGADIILWPEKETSLVEGFRKPEAENQVFFIDDTGALCARHSGHAMDAEDGTLRQRHRRPMSFPYPNPHSHPLPRFWYSSPTKEIHVLYQCDPAYPALESNSASSNAWRKASFVLTAVPERKPRSILEDASEAFSTVISNPLSPFTSIFGGFGTNKASTSSTVAEVHDSDIEIREEELMEEDRGAEEEEDDSPSPLRKVRVVKVNETQPVTLATKLRRSWEVIPLRWTRATNTTLVSPPLS